MLGLEGRGAAAGASSDGVVWRARARGVTAHGVDVAGVDVNARWVPEGDVTLLVNGIDVLPFVEAELDRRFPGRADRRAADPAGLRAAWGKLEKAWDAALVHAAALPEGSVDISVDGEWSLSQRLRHLVMVTDTWLRGTVEEIRDPYHPIGLPSAEYIDDGDDLSPFSFAIPPYDEVIAVRTGRIAMVRDFLAAASPDLLDETRLNLWVPEYEEVVRSCLHTILEEEWEHLRLALRDLCVLERALDG